MPSSPFRIDRRHLLLPSNGMLQKTINWQQTIGQTGAQENDTHNGLELQRTVLAGVRVSNSSERNLRK